MDIRRPRRRRQPRKIVPVSFRVDAKTDAELDAVCELMGGMDRSDYIRNAIANQLRQDWPLVEQVRAKRMRDEYIAALDDPNSRPSQMIAAYTNAHPRARGDRT